MGAWLVNRSRETLLELAKRVMRETKRPEDNIRQDIGRLLDALEVENILTYRTDAGPAGLYLPRRRVIIETKAIGLADDPEKPQARENSESGRQQLERYLHSERESELATPPPEGDAGRRWTGLLTDGVIWHGWHYDPKTGDTLGQCLKSFRPGTAEETPGQARATGNQGSDWKTLDSRKSGGDIRAVRRTAAPDSRSAHGRGRKADGHQEAALARDAQDIEHGAGERGGPAAAVRDAFFPCDTGAWRHACAGGSGQCR